MSAPARRALLRWAVRLFRREWRQQVLVLTLLLVAVAATVVGIALAVNASGSQSAELGTADHILTVSGQGAAVAADVAAAQTAFGAAEAVAHVKQAVPGSVSSLDVRDQAVDGVFGRSMLRLDTGRLPQGPDEVALTDGAASALGAATGTSVDVGGHSRVVVGIVENPLKLSDEFVLVAPGQLDQPDRTAIFVRATQDQLRAFRMPDGKGLIIQGFSLVSAAQAAAVVLAISAVGMVFVGLLVVAGFAVLAQRRLRSLGMLGAIGATDRQVRLAMLASGLVVGAVGAALGAALGLAGWFAVAGRLEALLDHRIDRWALPWWSVGATVGLALVTAIGAAWWPARAASRLPVVAALAGRPPRPRPSHHFAAVGLVLAGGGYAMLAAAHQRTAMLVVGGTVATMLGVLFLAPLAIKLAGLAVRRSPVSIRLAARDLVRYRSRSGAALGAAALALGIAATVAIGASSAQAAERRSATPTNLPADELIVYAGDQQGPVPILPSATVDAARAAVDQIVSAVGASSVVLLEVAVNASGPGVPSVRSGTMGKVPAELVKVTHNAAGTVTEMQPVARLYVGTDEVLRYDGLDPASIDPSVDVLTARRDVQLDADRVGDAEHAHVPVFQHLDRTAYGSSPTTLLTNAAVQRLGLTPTPVAWAVRTTRALTGAQLADARRIAAAAGLSIETRDRGSGLQSLRTDATVIGVLVALGVLAMTVGLIRSETAGDMRTLAAMGASDRTRRSIVGATAGVLGALGGLLGTLGAYLALLAWHRGKVSQLGRVPVVELLVILVGLPLLAAAGGWILAGREPSSMARAPLG